MAALVGQSNYLSLQRHAEASELETGFGPDGPQILVVSGSGDYESSPQVRHDFYLLRWAVALDNQPGPCAFNVSLVPKDGTEPVVAVETSTTDTEQGPASGPDSAWGPPAGGTWHSFTVLISSACTWAVTLMPLAHD